MFKLYISMDTSEIDAFFRKADSFLSGNTPALMGKLGQRVAADMREMVESGGPLPKGRGYTSGTMGGEADESPKPWERTHPRWQQLRNKDDRPLFHTGKFAGSFGYDVVDGLNVDVGSSDIRSRRFHFGDAALGQRWSWSAWVDDAGHIADSNQPLSGVVETMGAGYRIKRFSPVIQPRNWMVIWENTVDEWFTHDVGGQLGIYP